jgi:hypothetical protein
MVRVLFLLWARFIIFIMFVSSLMLQVRGLDEQTPPSAHFHTRRSSSDPIREPRCSLRRFLTASPCPSVYPTLPRCRQSPAASCPRRTVPHPLWSPLCCLPALPPPRRILHRASLPRPPPPPSLLAAADLLAATAFTEPASLHDGCSSKQARETRFV